MVAMDYDCLIVGGGPAGLTAAIYLTRFHLDIRVIDAGNSRASWIPCTRNHAGYPDGISGEELIRLMTEQAQKYGAKIETARVTRLARIEGGFEADWGSGCETARTVLLATGVTNRRPPMDEDIHNEALARGLIRYCPICDGYEVTDKRVGIIGDDSHGVAEAVFLRGYTPHVTLIAPHAEHRKLQSQDWAKLDECAIAALDGPVTDMRIVMRWSSSPQGASSGSTASIRRSAPTSIRGSRGWSASTCRETGASWSTATSARRCPASTRRATL
jgi:thioredoxin reductase (NADPH)